ncbi:MAG: glycerol-3-phosphate dehydrogenase/oxidase [Acidobacteriota bacterium]
MIRDLDRLTARTFDLLVVGGGVYGLAIAYDAAQRGLAVALIERDDFGSGSSFNHLRTIHGGLRYLQTLDLRRARESVRERNTLARIAPHAVRPLPFALPLYRSLRAGKTAMRAGFLLDRLVAFDRNRRIAPALRLPAGRVVPRSEAAERFPGLRRQGLTGAAVWFDYVTAESDRLTFGFATAADEHGAALANHVEAVAPLTDGRRVTGVRARDRPTGREFDIGAQLIVNATGASVDALLGPLGISMKMPLLKAINLVTRRDAGDEALGGQTASGRHLFLVPWRGRALIGTWESAATIGPAPVGVAEAELAPFIVELNQAFPALDLTLADVSLVHRGLVPAVPTASGGVRLDGHERVRDHALDGVDGLISVAGTKYTTVRAVAQRVVDRAMAKLQRPPVPCRTATHPLPGGSIRDLALSIGDARRDHDVGLPSDAIPHLVTAYGSRYRDVLDLAQEQPAWRTRLADASPVIGAQLIWAARREMAVTLADAVIRRTPLGALGHPGDAAMARAAQLVGDELGWSEERRREEMAAVKRFYEIR